MSALLRRQKTAVAEPIAEGENGETRENGGDRGLDKSFGYSKNFGAKYELGKEVGRGHFGHTCWAKCKKGVLKNQSVAVKIITKAKMTTAISIEDVRREVKLLKGLSGHKHMVQFHDAFEDDQNVYIVMELCEGGELLDRILARGGRYTENDAKSIVVQILSVASFCHLQGVVHRDLKPENFLFSTRDEDSALKVIDFGLSDYARPDQRLNDIVGSAYYVAPEEKNDCFQALTHPWLRDEDRAVPLDILIYKLVKSYLRSSPLKRAALKALSKALSEDEIIYLRAQFDLLEPKDGYVSLDNFRMALVKHSTAAMKDSRVLDILDTMKPLSYTQMTFEEFCAAAISPHQLEALEGWETIATTAFEFFELEGNRVISVEALAQEMNVGPSAHTILRDWIRNTDGKLNFLGYAKLLHGLTIRSNTRHH
ncbi:hypothetical protein CTI12_AA032280 [Artemisia annua]|uniref:non-specific serine/threonine protein kinase n=1 Tax=Artemisia annua TaxID=35608 RepID=A0A2U1QGN9_ARTAN|nr:hypothetical protein CTI12_AA032280 [Artemisia annua]